MAGTSRTLPSRKLTAVMAKQQLAVRVIGVATIASVFFIAVGAYAALRFAQKGVLVHDAILFYG